MYKMVIALVLLGQLANAGTNCQKAYMEIIDATFVSGKASATTEVLTANAIAGNFNTAAQASVTQQIDAADTKFQEVLAEISQKNPDFVNNCLK